MCLLIVAYCPTKFKKLPRANLYYIYLECMFWYSKENLAKFKNILGINFEKKF